jgi:hypothetical protein
MEIKIIERAGIREAVEAVARSFFSGDHAAVERHFEGTPRGQRHAPGYQHGELVGILTIRWNCRYPPFHREGIPLIHYIEIQSGRRDRGSGPN